MLFCMGGFVSTTDRAYCEEKEKYTVVYLGTNIREKDTMDVLVEKANIPPHKSRTMYMDPPRTFKNGLSLSKAREWEKWLSNKGIAVKVVPDKSRPELREAFRRKMKRKKEAPTQREKLERSRKKDFDDLLKEGIVKIDRIRFHSDREKKGSDEEVFAEEFPKSTRYVYTEITLHNTIYGKDIPENIKTLYKCLVEIKYYYPDGRRMGTFKQRAWMNPEKDEKVITSLYGWGYKQPGKWKPGTYRVEVGYPGDEPLAESEFTIFEEQQVERRN